MKKFMVFLCVVLTLAACSKRKLNSVTGPEEYFTPTRTFTQTFTDTNTPGPTFTFTFTYTASSTFTFTNTFTATYTPTQTNTLISTYTHSFTPVFTNTITPSNTYTHTGTWTPLPTNTYTLSFTSTSTITCTPTITITSTLTVTPTPVINKGTANITPQYVIASGTGNTIKIEYTAGEYSWFSNPPYGTLKINIPQGWSPPSLVTTDPGYFTANVSNGTLVSTSVSGSDIIIQASGLNAYSGKISVYYGSKQDGGPGVTAQSTTGTAEFNVSMASSGSEVTPIDVQPFLNVINEQGTINLQPSECLYPSSGNSFTFIYTPSYDWDAYPSYGTLIINVPEAFDPPSLSSSDNGYFTVQINGGILKGKSINGRNMIIQASGIPAYAGGITVIYGVKTGGGLGISPQAPGEYVFMSYANPGAGDAFALSSQPILSVREPTHTATITFTYSVTPTLTISPTSSRTGTITRTVTSTSTATRTHTPTFTITLTHTNTPTFTISMTHTISQTWTLSPTFTITRTATVTRTPSPTVTTTSSRTFTRTATETRTPTATRTSTPTVTESITPTRTPVLLQFEDPNFEGAVRAYLAIPTETPVLSTDVEFLTTFSAQNSMIGSIRGIEYFKALNTLILYGNSISDITPLSGLLDLKYLDLNNNNISDITALVINSQSGGIGAGATVYLQLNPLSSQAINTDIPILNGAGAAVFW